MPMLAGREHGVLLLHRNKPLKLFDPALAIVTGDRAGHCGSDRGRLVLQSRATILGRSNGFSLKGHSALGSAGNGLAGLLFLLFGYSQGLFALHTNPHSVINICNTFTLVAIVMMARENWKYCFRKN